LLPDDMADFTIFPAVDVDVVQMLETTQSSRPLPISQISPGDSVESGIASINPSDATLSDKFPCPEDYFEALEDQIRCVPVSTMMRLKHLIRTRLRYFSMFRSCHGSLRTNGCFICFELGLQILWALRDASSWTLRDRVQQLFCSR
jgi:hypothetical protein